MQRDYQRMRRVPVDPRMVEEIGRSPRMLAEQGPDFMGGWGGSAQYQALARMPMRERLTYAAVLDNHATAEEIASVTGLSVAEVAKALGALQEQSLVAKT